jgi:hypothetical protein
MKTIVSALAQLTNQQLVAEVETLAARERQATARLIASLAELEKRRLYLGEGCASLFSYCTERLHLSEDAAYNHAEVARAAARYPVILDLLDNGSITVTAVRLLAKQLTPENHRALLAAAMHKSKRDVERQVAALRPQPDVPSAIRKLPSSPKSAQPASSADAPLAHHEDAVSTPPPPVEARSQPPLATPPAAPPRQIVAPLASDRFKVQFTIGRDTHDKLRKVQDLMRHAVPNGDPGIIFERGLALLLADLEKKKMAQATRPRRPREGQRHSRYIPASVRREVWARDGARCAFVGSGGIRCTERAFLELHHVVPFAEDGEPTATNLQVRCKAHNAYEAETHFGWRWVRERAADAWLEPRPKGESHECLDRHIVLRRS